MTLCVAEGEVVGLLYIFLFVFWIIYLYSVRHYGYWEQRKVSHVPAVFPFGSLTNVVVGHNYDETMLDKIYKDFEGHRFVGFVNIREPCLLLRDPELIEKIMREDFEYFMDRGWLDVNPKDYLVANLITKTGKEWKEMRKKLAPAYDGVFFKATFCLLWESSTVLLQEVERRISREKLIKVKDILSQYATNVFGACTFGTDINSPSKEDVEFYKVCGTCMDTDYIIKVKLFIYFAFPIITRYHLFDMINSEVAEAFKRKVRTTIECREEENANKCDFIDLLLRIRQNESVLNGCSNSSKHGGKEGLSLEEITSETFGFFALGHEKTSLIAQYCLYELASNQSIQEKLFQEIQQVLDNGLKCGLDTTVLEEMPYLDQVVKETLRRYPVFPTTYRKCTRNYKIANSNLTIEKGLRLLIPIFSIQHDPKYFPEPFVFNPDRFSTRNCLTRHPCAFLPFGIGPRKCIGYRFGLMTMKLAVARLISKYHVDLSSDTPVPLQFTNDSYMTKPLKPIKLIFKTR